MELRYVPAHFCRKGPTESSAPLLKTVDQYAAGVKFAATFCVHTSTVMVCADDCNSFLCAHGDSCSCHAEETRLHHQNWPASRHLRARYSPTGGLWTVHREARHVDCIQARDISRGVEHSQSKCCLLVGAEWQQALAGELQRIH